MCEKHAASKDERVWGFPTGSIDCDTYSFVTQRGSLHVGHSEEVVDTRWWIPVGLESQAFNSALAIAFEMNIPRERNMHLSVHYVVDSHGRIYILHKGKFAIGRSSVSMSEFFAYYRKHPGRWQLMQFSNYEYLVLGRVNLDMTDTDFTTLLKSLADFAGYVPRFKDTYR